MFTAHSLRAFCSSENKKRTFLTMKVVWIKRQPALRKLQKKKVFCLLLINSWYICKAFSTLNVTNFGRNIWRGRILEVPLLPNQMSYTRSIFIQRWRPSSFIRASIATLWFIYQILSNVLTNKDHISVNFKKFFSSFCTHSLESFFKAKHWQVAKTRFKTIFMCFYNHIIENDSACITCASNTLLYIEHSSVKSAFVFKNTPNAL